MPPLIFFLRFSYLFYVCECIVDIFKHTRREHQIPLQMVACQELNSGPLESSQCSYPRSHLASPYSDCLDLIGLLRSFVWSCLESCKPRQVLRFYLPRRVMMVVCACVYAWRECECAYVLYSHMCSQVHVFVQRPEEITMCYYSP